MNDIDKVVPAGMITCNVVVPVHKRKALHLRTGIGTVMLNVDFNKER